MYMGKDVRMYALEPIFSFKSSQKQSSYLVKAKLRTINRPVGSFKCNQPHCEVWVNVFGAETSTSTVTRKKIKINHLKLLIVMRIPNISSQCNQCKHFWFRWSIYNCGCHKHAQGQVVKQKHLPDHLTHENHDEFMREASMIFINKTDPLNPLKREHYRRCTLKKLAPYDLSTSESV